MDQHKEESMANGARNPADEDLTRAVLASFGGSRSERFRQVLQSLVRHLHAFVKDVELTEEEWFRGIDFLTRTGHITDDKRQEFILLSDVLGVSMLVIEINHKRLGEATASTVFGPFFVEGSPRFANGDDLANGASGEPCFMQGRVLSITGEPIPDAHIEVWQADDKGFYDVQYKELSQARGRGHLYSDREGRYYFWSVRPEAYPIPDDGPVGELLDAANRSPISGCGWPRPAAPPPARRPGSGRPPALPTRSSSAPPCQSRGGRGRAPARAPCTARRRSPCRRPARPRCGRLGSARP